MLSTRSTILIALLILVLATWLIARASRAQLAQPSGLQTPERTELPAEPVEVPLRFVEHLAIVDVRVNGQGPLAFGLDTGGQGTARADDGLVEKLGLEVVGQVMGQDGSGSRGTPMEVVRIDSIAIGDARFSGLAAPSRDYGGRLPGELGRLEGILGFHLFADVLLTIDPAAERLRLERGELPAVDGRDILQLLDDTRGPKIVIAVGEASIEAVLDSRMMGGLQLPAEAAQPFLASQPVVVGRGRTVAGEFELKEAKLSSTVSIGRHQLPEPRVLLVDRPGAAVLGSTVLRHFALTFDQRNRRVRFSRQGEGPIEHAPRYRAGIAFGRRSGLEGLLVARVLAGGAGEKAGLRQGDVVVAISGRPASEMADRIRTLLSSPDPVRLTVERAGEELEVEVVPQRAD